MLACKHFHPNYSSKIFLNDIAILKLTSPFNINADVSLCCLPPNGTLLSIMNEPDVIFGWDTTQITNSTSTSYNLLETVIQIQGSSSYSDVSSTSNSQFCAGGPLMTSVHSLWTCTGIVSFGQDCDHSGYYTRVSYYRSFIDDAIKTMSHSILTNKVVKQNPDDYMIR
jgi:secreted trypsin-like serine protease